MKKEEFNKLTLEHQLIVIDKHQNLLSTSIHSRMGLLPFIAGLSAALLVIATFNDKLIPIDNTVRIIISVLVMIIPTCLYLYNEDLKRSADKNKNYIEELLGITTPIEHSFKNKITAYTPDIVIFVIFFVSLIIIYKIWVLYF